MWRHGERVSSVCACSVTCADKASVPGPQADEALGKHNGGPFFLGDFSYVDAMFLPSLERFAANMPFVRGLHLKGRPELPRLDAWFHALDARPTYQQVFSRPALNLMYLYNREFV